MIQNTEISKRVNTIMDSDTMLEWLDSVGRNVYGGGSHFSLYLDLDDDSLMVDTQADSNSWRQRDDGSLVRIATYNNMDSEECEPYDDWEQNARLELEGAIYDAINGEQGD